MNCEAAKAVVLLLAGRPVMLGALPLGVELERDGSIRGETSLVVAEESEGRTRLENKKHILLRFPKDRTTKYEKVSSHKI